MGALFPTYNRWEIAVESAEGTRIIAKDGKEYLDFVAGIAVCNLGHRHPIVQKALEQQLQKVWHVSNLFENELQEETAQLLVQHCSGDAVFFCNSGAEANEAALKLARKYTGRSKVITFKQSFHGRTFATMSATGQEKIYQGFGPLLPEFIHLPYNDIAALEKEMNEEIAAVMVEIVQGEGGVRPIAEQFLKKIEKLCRQYGALLIVDEVQTGIGRTGEAFAYQHYDISPDIITVAKGLGSGFPVGAMIGKEFLRNSFTAGVHGSTFGGNPLAMAAAKATLQVIFQEKFLQEVSEKGEYFKQILKEELKDCSIVKEIRGLGLMIGIECSGDVSRLIKNIHTNGLLVLAAGPNVIRLLPPLIVTKEELNQAVDIIKNTLTKEWVTAK
jgi:acetylornithine/N-succinyldiaminopimelate aminotransferase